MSATAFEPSDNYLRAIIDSAERPLQEGKLKINVLIDARKISNNGIGHGGIGVYLENLLNGFLARNDISPTLLVNSASKIPEAWKDIPRVIDDAKLYSYDELKNLSKRINWSEYNLFHTPHYILPYGIPIPTIITVHDLIHITNPSSFFHPFVARFLIGSALKRATKVITVSEASKKAIIHRWPAADNKITVIPNAVVPGFMQEPLKLNRKGEYLLTVLSSNKKHKGSDILLKAFQLFEKENVNNKVELVIVGKGSIQLEDRKDLPKKTVVLGEVSREELHSLYYNAKALIVPSRAEGFCLPVVEAQSCGTPVLMTPVPAVLELLTENDIALKDFSAKEMAIGIEKIISKNDDEKGVTSMHLEKFCIRKVTERIVELYRSI